MLTVTMTKGLPGSGKSHWAIEEVLKSNGATKRVNKDDLRGMIDGGEHSKGREKFVRDIQKSVIWCALLDGYHVIVDNTNFREEDAAEIKELVDAVKSLTGKDVKIEWKVFNTPLEECIARDLKRSNSVGEKVIRSFYNKYLRPQPEPWTPADQNERLPGCAIVDIDGTVAKNVGRSPYDWSRVGEDEPHKDIIELACHLDEAAAIEIIFVSGRSEECRDETAQWLQRHVGRHWGGLLYMRPAGNNEKDSIIKGRIYNEHIKGKYNVRYVIDDRDQVVKMWRSLGLRCLQVADGAF